MRQDDTNGECDAQEQACEHVHAADDCDQEKGGRGQDDQPHSLSPRLLCNRNLPAHNQVHANLPRLVKALAVP